MTYHIYSVVQKKGTIGKIPLKSEVFWGFSLFFHRSVTAPPHTTGVIFRPIRLPVREKRDKEWNTVKTIVNKQDLHAIIVIKQVYSLFS